jgi:hypothetical protein
MQDRRRLSSERRGKQGLSVTRVTAVRSGSHLADVSTVYSRQQRAMCRAGCECINFALAKAAGGQYDVVAASSYSSGIVRLY